MVITTTYKNGDTNIDHEMYSRDNDYFHRYYENNLIQGECIFYRSSSNDKLPKKLFEIVDSHSLRRISAR